MSPVSVFCFVIFALIGFSAAQEDCDACSQVIGKYDPDLVKDCSEANGLVYWRLEQKLSWDEAEADCVDVGGNLASIHGFDEKQLVKDLADSEGTWIGLYRSNRDGPCDKGLSWSDGSDYDYEDWSPNQPDCVLDKGLILKLHDTFSKVGGYDDPKEHCVELAARADFPAAIAWNDRICSGRRKAICKAESNAFCSK